MEELQTSDKMIRAYSTLMGAERKVSNNWLYEGATLFNQCSGFVHTETSRVQ